MKIKSSRVARIAIVLGMLISASTAWAATPDEMVKEVRNHLRECGSKFASREIEKSLVAFSKATTALDELKAAAPDCKSLKSLQSSYDRTSKKLIAKVMIDANNTIGGHCRMIEGCIERNREDERQMLKDRCKQLAEDIEKLRPLLKIAGKDGEDLLKEARAALNNANAAVGEIIASDFLANDWADQLQPFTSSGAKDLRMAVNGPPAFVELKKRYAAAMPVWEQYRKVNFPKGKTEALGRAEREVEFGLTTAKKTLATVISRRRERVEALLKQISDFFAADTQWKKDKTAMPKAFSALTLMQATEAMDDLAEYLPADDATLKTLQAKFAAINKENAARAEARKALTFVLPDKYTQKDLKKLKSFIGTIMRKANPKAKVLRATIISEDWSEATVTEWTDTTHTAWRTRTTRTVKACVAAKDDKGVFRDFAYINQDKGSNGRWGRLYGHLTQNRTPMLEENVEKDASK